MYYFRFSSSLSFPFMDTSDLKGLVSLQFFHILICYFVLPTQEEKIEGSSASSYLKTLRKSLL